MNKTAALDNNRKSPVYSNQLGFLSLPVLIIILVLVAVGAYLYLSYSGNLPNSLSLPGYNNSKTPNTYLPTNTTNNSSTQDKSLTIPSQTASVSITSKGFTPSTLKVKAGTEVTFTNTDSTSHQITSKDLSELDSGQPLEKDESYSYTFDKEGTYTYQDPTHPTLKGTIMVE